MQMEKVLDAVVHLLTNAFFYGDVDDFYWGYTWISLQ